MNIPIHHIQPLIYTNPDGLQLGVQFILDLDKRGYINATAIAKQFGMKPIHWLRNQNVQQYIDALIDNINFKGANSHLSTKSISYHDIAM